jgi:hypothetical protein
MVETTESSLDKSTLKCLRDEGFARRREHDDRTAERVRMWVIFADSISII